MILCGADAPHILWVVYMDFLRFLEQNRTPLWDKFFSIITYLGWETIFLVVALVMIWCINKKYGFFILYCGLIGQATSQWLKLYFRVERPWIAYPDFNPVSSAIKEAGGFSFPSGHTQIATTTYGGLAFLYRKKKWLSLLFGILVLLVAFSRMYLGVHYPSDVIFSLVFNSALVVFVYYFGKKYTSDILSDILRLFGILIMGSLFAFALVKVRASLDVEVYKDTLDFASKMFGATLAFSLCWYLDDKHLHFETKAPFAIQFIKVVIGTAILLAIKEGMKPLMNLIGINATVGHIIRYFAVVFFAGYIWPCIFTNFVKKR